MTTLTCCLNTVLKEEFSSLHSEEAFQPAFSYLLASTMPGITLKLRDGQDNARSGRFTPDGMQVCSVSFGLHWQ
jgi:hypothetical protein